MRRFFVLLLMLAGLSASAPGQQSPFLPEDTYDKLTNEISGDIANYHRRCRPRFRWSVCRRCLPAEKGSAGQGPKRKGRRASRARRRIGAFRSSKARKSGVRSQESEVRSQKKGSVTSRQFGLSSSVPNPGFRAKEVRKSRTAEGG